MARRNHLGLHTAREQEDALDLAAKAYMQAIDANHKGDRGAFEFAVGYLNAIVDLAHSEGVHDLESEVGRMVRRLVALRSTS